MKKASRKNPNRGKECTFTQGRREEERCTSINAREMGKERRMEQGQLSKTKNRADEGRQEE